MGNYTHGSRSCCTVALIAKNLIFLLFYCNKVSLVTADYCYKYIIMCINN